MSYCLTSMTIKAKNDADYKTVKEWCELFEKSDKIYVYDPSENMECFSISYDELNIGLNEARDVFEDFAEFCIVNAVEDELQMHFWISFGNSGDEYQLLYSLKDGEATEQIAYRDLTESDEIPTEQNIVDDWNDCAEYSEPQKIKLSDRKNSDSSAVYTKNGVIFDADQILLDALEKNNIPHDDNTLNEISVRDAYDILAGTYDKDAANARPVYRAEDFQGKKIVLSGITDGENRDFFHGAVEWLKAIEKRTVGPDTDYVVYNEKKGQEGEPYWIARELNSKGQNIILVPFEDFMWLAY